MKPSKSLSTLATALIAGSHVVNAIEVDLTSPGLYWPPYPRITLLTIIQPLLKPQQVQSHTT